MLPFPKDKAINPNRLNEANVVNHFLCKTVKAGFFHALPQHKHILRRKSTHNGAKTKKKQEDKFGVP